MSTIRLMLGRGITPDLLVEVVSQYNPDMFGFHVVNGCWNGVFTNGYITVRGCAGGDYTSIDTTLNIICNDQDRLGGDYNDVFSNFDNIHYVSPNKTTHRIATGFDDMDDDIPF